MNDVSYIRRPNRPLHVYALIPWRVIFPVACVAFWASRLDPRERVIRVPALA